MQNQPAQTQNVYREHPLAGVRVLLVEDELDIADLLLFILQEAGAEVTWVTQADEALFHVNQNCPDILVSNVRLPRQDGDWLIRQIRATETESSQHLPAIAVTSYTREFAASRMLEAGFEEFLPKDFESGQLISTILRLID